MQSQYSSLWLYLCLSGTPLRNDYFPCSIMNKNPFRFQNNPSLSDKLCGHCSGCCHVTQIPLPGLRCSFLQRLGVLGAPGSQWCLIWKLPSVEENHFAQVHDPPLSWGSWPVKEGGRHKGLTSLTKSTPSRLGHPGSVQLGGLAEAFVAATL